MKTKQIIFAALFFIFSISLISAQELDNNELAKRVLQESFNVQNGDVVLIVGGQHTMDLFEAFTIEATKLGAVAFPVMNTDKMFRSFYQNVPDNYIGLYDTFYEGLLKIVDVEIYLPRMEDYEAIVKDVPKENIAKIKKGNQATNKIFGASGIRGGYISYPNKSMIAYDEADFNIYKKMYWKAISADYKKIAQNAKTLEKLFENSKNVEVTSPKGTKISFSVTGRKCFINDGIVDKNEEKSEVFSDRWVNFPAGRFYVSVVENSGNGKVFVPKDILSFKTKEKIENISFKVKKGKLSKLKADKGEEILLKLWSEYIGPIDTISGFQIGLNPEMKVMGDNVDYRHNIAGGMVYIIFGDNSKWGGENKVSSGYLFPITNATVKIDGKVVIKDGKLMLD